MKSPLRLALLISGGGTTMEKIIQESQCGELLGKIAPVIVIASRYGAGGLAKAKELGIPTSVLAPHSFSSAEHFGNEIISECRSRGVDLIGQYGWLPKTPGNVIEAFATRMINQHPGPLDPGRPDFGGNGMYGRRVHAARLYFVRCVQHGFWTEATAQRVDVEFDKGVVLRKRLVEIHTDDDPTTLQERVLPIEHAVQIETLADFADGRVGEVVREQPLVNTVEENVLKTAKNVACLLFPHG